MSPFVVQQEPTGYSHPKCYMGFLNQCCRKRSREHLMSEGIQSQIDWTKGNGLVSPSGERIENPPFPLAQTASVLCKRHNEHFGKALDVCGIQVATALLDFAKEKFDTMAVSVDGHDFERFLLQRLCAFHHGGIFTSNGQSLRGLSMPKREFQNLMMENLVEDGAGLFLTIPPRHHLEDTLFGYEVAPIHTATDIIGVRVSLGPVAFILKLVKFEYPFEEWGPRPAGFQFVDGDRRLQIDFNWTVPPGSDGVMFTIAS